MFVCPSCVYETESYDEFETHLDSRQHHIAHATRAISSEFEFLQSKLAKDQGVLVDIVEDEFTELMMWLTKKVAEQ